MKPAVLVKDQFEDRGKNFFEMFSLEFSNYQDTDAREKNNGFLVENLSTGAVFPTDIFLQEIEMVVAQN